MSALLARSLSPDPGAFVLWQVPSSISLASMQRDGKGRARYRWIAVYMFSLFSAQVTILPTSSPQPRSVWQRI